MHLTILELEQKYFYKYLAVTVYELLFTEIEKFSGGNKIGSFYRSRGAERPA